MIITDTITTTIMMRFSSEIEMVGSALVIFIICYVIDSIAKIAFLF